MMQSTEFELPCSCRKWWDNNERMLNWETNPTCPHHGLDSEWHKTRNIRINEEGDDGAQTAPNE